MDTVYYTPREVAEHLKLRVQTVYEYIREGRLPAIRLGNRCRIAHSDLEAFLADRRSGASVVVDTAERSDLSRQPQARGASDPSPGDQGARNEAARRLLAEWMADESGYDERVWPTVERLLQDHPVSLRQTRDGRE